MSSAGGLRSYRQSESDGAGVKIGTQSQQRRHSWELPGSVRRPTRVSTPPDVGVHGGETTAQVACFGRAGTGALRLFRCSPEGLHGGCGRSEQLLRHGVAVRMSHERGTAGGGRPNLSVGPGVRAGGWNRWPSHARAGPQGGFGGELPPQAARAGRPGHWRAGPSGPPPLPGGPLLNPAASLPRGARRALLVRPQAAELSEVGAYVRRRVCVQIGQWHPPAAALLGGVPGRAPAAGAVPCGAGGPPGKLGLFGPRSGPKMDPQPGGPPAERRIQERRRLQSE